MYYWTMNEQVRAIDKLSKPMCPDRYSIEAKKWPDPQDYESYLSSSSGADDNSSSRGKQILDSY